MRNIKVNFLKKERLRDQIRNYEKAEKRMRKPYIKRDLLTKTARRKQERDSHYTQILALALNVWTAPLRNDLIEAFFIKSSEFPAPYNDKTSTQNSLWFEEERQQWMLVMKKDKLTTRSAVASNKNQQDEMALLGKIPAPHKK